MIPPIQLQNGKKIFFASDFHLHNNATEREQKVIAWLDSIQADAQVVFLVGDVFDFWFEYNTVVPKGFLGFFSKIIQLSNQGIEVFFFTGNHDLWMKDYFTETLGIQVFHRPVRIEIISNNKKTSFFIGHGDGLGPGDWTYKNVLKPIFISEISQFLFRWLHPDIGIRLAHKWSSHSRAANKGNFEKFHGEENEWIFLHCKEVEQRQHHDYYVFGHRHLAMQLAVSESASYVNLGEWFNGNHYAVFDGKELTLTQTDGHPPRIS